MAIAAAFFVTEGTLARDAVSYLNRSADADLLRALEAGDFAYVLDSRQKGKSSLMIRTRQALRERGFVTLVLDLQRFGSNLTADRWYASLLQAVAEQLGKEEAAFKLWDKQVHAGSMRKFFGALESLADKSGNRFVIFVDEVDYVRSLPFSTDEFFAGIRECHNRKAAGDPMGLTFCLMGVATPSELIRDVQITPFNIGRRIELADFTLAELAPYAEPLSSSDRDGKRLLARIFHWTCGHPYLTQKLASRVAADESVRSPGGVDRLVEEMFFSLKARAQDPNLADVARRVLESPVEGLPADEARSRVLDLYRQVMEGRVRDDETDPVVSVLKLSGLTTVLQGYLAVRNRIYFRSFDRMWVEGNLPEGEVLRQRRAARRAAWRVGSVAAIITAAIAGLAIFGFAQTRRASAALVEARKGEQEARLFADKAASSDQASEQARNRAEAALVQAKLEAKRAKDATAKALAATKVADAQKQLALVSKNLAEQQRTAALAAKADSDHLYYQGIMNLLGSAWTNRQFDRMERLLSEADSRRFNSIRGPEIELHRGLLHAEERSFTMPGDTTFALRLSSDGRLLATASKKSGAQIWNLNSERLIRSLPNSPRDAYNVEFSRDQRLLLVTGDPDVAVFDVNTGRLRARFPQVSNPHISPDGGTVFAASRNTRLGELYSVKTGERLFTLPPKATIGFWQGAFSPSSRRLVTWELLGDDRSTFAQEEDQRKAGSPYLWDTATGKLIARLGSNAYQVQKVLFSPDDKKIATSGDDANVCIWSNDNGLPIAALKGPGGYWDSVQFSPDSKRLLAASSGWNFVHNPVYIDGYVAGGGGKKWLHTEASKPFDGESYNLEEDHFEPPFRPVACQWDVTSGRVLDTFDLSIGPGAGPYGESIQPGSADAHYLSDGIHVVTGALSLVRPRLWTIGSSAPVREFARAEGMRVEAISPDCSKMFFSDASGVGFLLDSRTAERTSSSLVFGETAEFCRTGRRLLTLGFGTARLYDPGSGASLQLTAESGSSRVAGDHRFLAQRNGRFEVFDAITGQTVTSFPLAADALDVTRDGSTVAFIAGRKLYLWDPISAKVKLGPVNIGSLANYTNDNIKVEFNADEDLVKISAFLVLPKSASGIIYDWRSTVFDVKTGARSPRTWYARNPQLYFRGKYLTLRPQVVQVRDEKSTQVLVELEGHTGRINMARPSFDGRRVVTTGSDNTYRLWDPTNGRELFAARVEGRNPLARFSHDNSVLLVESTRNPSNSVEMDAWPLTAAARQQMRGKSDVPSIATDLRASAAAGDLFAWRWQTEHWLDPIVQSSPPVQAALLDALITASRPISRDAKRRIRSIPADYSKRRSDRLLKASSVEEGGEYLEEWLQSGRADAIDWTNAAFLRLERGDTGGYLQAAQRAVALSLRKGGSDLEVLNAVSAVFIRPGYPDDLSELLAATQRIFSKTDRTRIDPWLGALEFRMGRYENALRDLQSVRNPDEWANVFMAMCLAKMNRIDEARKALALVPQGSKLETYDWDAKIGLQLVGAEAHGMLEGK